MSLSRRSRLFLLSSFVLLFPLLWLNACNCEDDVFDGRTIEVDVVSPKAGPVSGDVDFSIKLTPEDAVQLVEIRITPQSRTQKRATIKIGELHKAPYTFRWNSVLVPDGFYRLEVVAFNEQKITFRSPSLLIQVINEPPKLWFVNCTDGQFVRGLTSLVVSLQQQDTLLKGAPRLFINGKAGPVTSDRSAPFRYLIDTTKYAEGEKLSLAVIGEDLRGNQRRITCRPTVDNLPPTLQFRNPNKDGTLLGRTFTVDFLARDRFGVREVRLLIDGKACQDQPSTPANGTDAGDGGAPDAPAPDGGADAGPDTSDKKSDGCSQSIRWVGTKSPYYPIEVKLPASYNTEQFIVLTARAVDQAGNISDPAIRLRVRIDPVPPEIFIRSPGQGELVGDKVNFTARITDNQSLEEITMHVETKSGKRVELLLLTPRTSQATPSITMKSVEKKLGFGRHHLVVTAIDQSGNKTTQKRLFLVGCADSTDCPPGQVCHKSRCLVPAGLNQPCNDDNPCAVGTVCVEGEAPFCSRTKRTYCRKRCNPGNKFVPSDNCAKNFYCDRDIKACIPSDGCLPGRGDCGPGRKCVMVDDDSGHCRPAGPIPIGKACTETCTGARNCGQDAWCVFLLDEGKSVCMKLCDTQNPKCPNNRPCLQLQWGFGGKPLRWGVCD